MIRTRAKPLTSSVPTNQRTTPESIVVRFESRIVDQALPKPLRICWASGWPAVAFLPHPLEDQHVGVDGHADRQGQPGQARQGDRTAGQGHRGEQQDHVRAQGDDRDDAGEVVVDDHEDRHDRQRDDDGVDPLADRVLAEGRADLLLLERRRVDRHRQAAGLEDVDQEVHLLAAGGPPR